MYALDELSADLETFRQVVAQRQAYRPLLVKIKLIFGCNLKCEMCNHWREPRERPLPMQRFQEILDDLAALGCRKVHLSGGEPLLRPKVAELVAYASQLGLRVTLTTNGTLVDKDLARELIQSGLRGVNVSIDSPERKIHDLLRGVEGTWKKACKAVRLFRRYAHKGKINIRINTVVSPSSYASLSALPDFASQLGADFINLIAVDDHCGEHLKLKRRQIEDYNANLAPQIAERALALGLIDHEDQAYPFGRDPSAYKHARRGEYAFGWYERHPCFAPWTHSLIDYNGLVYVCCMMREQTLPLGDLKQQSFAEIWNGPSYQRVRQMMFPPALKACRNCDDFLEQNRQLYAMLAAGSPLETQTLPLSHGVQSLKSE